MMTSHWGFNRNAIGEGLGLLEKLSQNPALTLTSSVHYESASSFMKGG